MTEHGNRDVGSRDVVHDFWNDQAALAEKAGSKDLLLKQLEVAALSRHIRDGMTLCEFGCGNGVTAIELARNFDVAMNCFDFAEAMIEAALIAARQQGVEQRVTFTVADVRSEPALERRYDVVYTERMLINLPNWEAQERAIRYLATNVAPGGKLLLCESSIVGLGELNQLRSAAGLDHIAPPWHNCYLDDRNVAALEDLDLRLVGVEEFSATYYFLSRVVNAWLAKREGIEPSYDAPVNQLALSLPPWGGCAQSRLWVFER